MTDKEQLEELRKTVCDIAAKLRAQSEPGLKMADKFLLRDWASDLENAAMSPVERLARDMRQLYHDAVNFDRGPVAAAPPPPLPAFNSETDWRWIVLADHMIARGVKP